jgi:hypothetical protein
MTITEKAQILRCAAPVVVAAYNLKVTRAKSTPHFSGFARLVSGTFCAIASKGRFLELSILNMMDGK